MIVTLVITALVDFGQQFGWLMAMIVLNNIFCATQDVAIDSLAVSNLRPSERARGNGFMFGGQYLGITLGGGVAVFVYGWLGFEASLAYVCLMLAANLLFVLRYVHDPQVDRDTPARTPSLREMSRTVFDFVAEVYRSFWRSGPGPMVGVLFALLPHGAIALAYATLGTIQVDYGLNENQIAELRIYNTIAAGLGCLLGGFLGDRFGIKRSTAAAFVLTALPTLLLGLQIGEFGLASVPLGQFYGLVVLHGLFYGMAFALGVAIFMGMTNPVVAATQFTAFMAMGNLAISMGNYWQGVVAERIGYDVVFYVDALLVLLPLLVLPFVRERKSDPVADGEPMAEAAPVVVEG
jgi:MFS family permease